MKILKIIRKIMKNMNKKNNLDPIAEIKKHSKFKRFSEEAEIRTRLAIEIYETRGIKKISQQELAKMAETTQKVISRIESGDVNIGIDLLQRIAKNLDFTIKNWANIFDKNFEMPEEKRDNKSLNGISMFVSLMEKEGDSANPKVKNVKYYSSSSRNFENSKNNIFA